MSWRDNLRPGSFRGVPFEVRGSGARIGRRGAHFEFPNRDRGAVEDLGEKDGRFSISAYVIGEDFIERRNALEAALLVPGKGELIHPTRGALQVIVDPKSDVSVRENARQGRMAEFSIQFILAEDAPQYPSQSPASPAGTDAAAVAVVAATAEVQASRVSLFGPSHIAEAANTDLRVQARGIEALRPLAQGPLSEGAAGADVQSFVQTLGFAATQPVGALDQLLALIDDVFTVVQFGKRVLVSASGVAIAARSLLAASAQPSSVAGSIADQRIQANRAAIAGTVQIAAVSYSARALVRRSFDSHGAALSSLKAFDQAVETIILREADRAQSDPALVSGLTNLRAVAREALLSKAANLIPVAQIDPSMSLPSLALAWRVSGTIDPEPDLIARNDIAHPMWCPSGALSVRLGGGNANA